MFIISAYCFIINDQILNNLLYHNIIIIIFRKYIINNKNKVVGPNFLKKFN